MKQSQSGRDITVMSNNLSPILSGDNSSSSEISFADIDQQHLEVQQHRHDQTSWLSTDESMDKEEETGAMLASNQISELGEDNDRQQQQQQQQPTKTTNNQNQNQNNQNNQNSTNNKHSPLSPAPEPSSHRANRASSAASLISTSSDSSACSLAQKFNLNVDSQNIRSAAASIIGGNGFSGAGSGKSGPGIASHFYEHKASITGKSLRQIIQSISTPLMATTILIIIIFCFLINERKLIQAEAGQAAPLSGGNLRPSASMNEFNSRGHHAVVIGTATKELDDFDGLALKPQDDRVGGQRAAADEGQQQQQQQQQQQRQLMISTSDEFRLTDHGHQAAAGSQQQHQRPASEAAEQPDDQNSQASGARGRLQRLHDLLAAGEQRQPTSYNSDSHKRSNNHQHNNYHTIRSSYASKLASSPPHVRTVSLDAGNGEPDKQYERALRLSIVNDDTAINGETNSNRNSNINSNNNNNYEQDRSLSSLLFGAGSSDQTMDESEPTRVEPQLAGAERILLRSTVLEPRPASLRSSALELFELGEQASSSSSNSNSNSQSQTDQSSRQQQQPELATQIPTTATTANDDSNSNNNWPSNNPTSVYSKVASQKSGQTTASSSNQLKHRFVSLSPAHQKAISQILQKKQHQHLLRQSIVNKYPHLAAVNLPPVSHMQQPDETAPQQQQQPQQPIEAGLSIKPTVSQFMEPRFDVPQIECNRTDEGFERIACPSQDEFGRHRCIQDNSFCDGYYDCPQGEDEDVQSCMFYKLFVSHIDILSNTFLTWTKKQNQLAGSIAYQTHDGA